MRRHGPVIAHCTDSEDFPISLLVLTHGTCSAPSTGGGYCTLNLLPAPIRLWSAGHYGHYVYGGSARAVIDWPEHLLVTLSILPYGNPYCNCEYSSAGNHSKYVLTQYGKHDSPNVSVGLMYRCIFSMIFHYNSIVPSNDTYLTVLVSHIKFVTPEVEYVPSSTSFSIVVPFHSKLDSKVSYVLINMWCGCIQIRVRMVE